MVEVLRKTLVPLLLAGGLMALGGCSGYSTNSGYQSTAANTPYYQSTAANTPYPYGESSAPKPYYRSPTYGNPACTVGPTAASNAQCDTLQDQNEVRHLH